MPSSVLEIFQPGSQFMEPCLMSVVEMLYMKSGAQVNDVTRGFIFVWCVLDGQRESQSLQV